MTRKQAIQGAIDILTAQGGFDEIVEKLKSIYKELPIVHWSDESIRDTVDQFILENNRLPTAVDFQKAGLPSHAVIKQKYKKRLSVWLDENYPTCRLTREDKKEVTTRMFIDEYMKIKPKTAKEYQTKRDKCNSRAWQSVLTYYKATNWRALIQELDLPIFEVSNNTDRRRSKVKVNIYMDEAFKKSQL